MNVVDPGHKFRLRELDGGSEQILTFVKREGEGYPGNVGHYPGTTMQECLRALISRATYVNAQIPDYRTTLGIEYMRAAIWEFEKRAAERHGRVLRPISGQIENERTCGTCGHIQCEGECHP